jgi:hypothetical protein
LSPRPTGCRGWVACSGRLGPVRSAATASIVAEQLVHLALGDAYQELVLGIGSPELNTFERQVDAALALLEVPSPVGA